MEMKDYVDEILLKLGGGIVKVELEDNNLIEDIVKSGLREIQRYINVSKYATIPYAPVIDLSTHKVQTITQVLRANTAAANYDFPDAMYLSMHKYAGGVNAMTDYRSYLRIKQVKNTLVTDLNYRWDDFSKRLYIQASHPRPDKITIVYIPLIDSIEDLTSSYWQDILMRLSLALAKQTLGRVRGKYVLNNALYSLDADQLLAEGNEELAILRESLQANSDMVLPID